MKKIFIILLLCFLPILVNAEETIKVKLEYVPNVYWNYKKDNILYWGQFAYIYADDKIAYCMDIETPVISSVYTKTNKVLSSEIIYGFAYFGYGYDGNNSLKDYMATQKILWSYTNSTDVYFTTQSNGNGTKIDISENENGVKFRFQKYAVFPTYNKLQFIIGTNNITENINNYTKEYIIINESNNNINLGTNNNLVFNANEIGKSNFYLETKYKYNYDNVFYIADNSQEILVVGNMENIKRTYTYEVIGGSININVQFDKKSTGSITDNKFELYNSDNELIGIYSPNKEGNIKINNLYMDTYKLKHVMITDGYNIDKIEYILNINESDLNLEQNIILNIKNTKISINKTYSNPLLNNIKYDSNIIYKIYDENNNYINEIVTNENGYAETILDYGNYKIVQSNTNAIDVYHDDIIIEKNMFNNEIEHKIYDEIYKSNLKIITLNKNTNKIIGNVNFKMNEQEYNTNEEGIYIINDLDYGIYNFDNIEFDGYTKINAFTYEINENSNFYIENEELYTDVMIYLEEIVEEEKENENFTSEEDISNNINDKTNNEINNNVIQENEDINSNEIIYNDTNEKESNYTSIEITEKLPFLGDKITNNEDSKIIYYIYNFIKFDWL